MAEDILHFGSVRMRVQGNGNLKMTLYNIDDTQSQTLVPFVMNPTPGNEPTRLSNFNTQRAKLRILTTERDEIFTINRIILFVKPIYTQYPG